MVDYQAKWRRNGAMIAVLTALTGLVGCAGQVQPQYVSPVQFQGWDCAQLHSEYARIGQQLKNGVEPEKRIGSGVRVGLGGGWSSGGGFGIGPTISVGMGQSQNSKRTEIAKLYGQMDAIEQAANFKRCPIQNPRVKQAKK